MTKNPLFFINPISGDGKKSKKVSTLYTSFFKPTYTIKSSYKNYFFSDEFINELCSKNWMNKMYYWIIFGGDGTINEIINSLYLNFDKPYIPKILIVPTGTGNGLAKNMGIELKKYKPKYIKKHIEQLKKTITTNKTKSVSVWKVRENTYLGYTKYKFSLLAQTFGIISDICSWRYKCKWLGKSRYGLVSFYYLLFPKYYSCKFSYKTSFNTKVLFRNCELLWFSALNQPYISQEVKLCPDSKNDNMLHLFFIKKKINLKQRIQLLLSLYKGTFSKLEFVSYCKVMEYRLGTNGKSKIMVDGEITNFTNIKVTNTKKKVQFYSLV